MNKTRGSHLLAVPACMLALMGCSANVSDPVLSGNSVDGTNTNLSRSIGSDTDRYQVYGKTALQKQLASGTIAAPQSATFKSLLAKVAQTEAPANLSPSANTALPAAATPAAVTVGFPMDLLGHQYVFGSVVTAVSAGKSETLGRLKLIDLTPMHVVPRVFQVQPGDFVFALTGCVQRCDESSDEQILLTIPILGVDPKTEVIALDLSALGQGLNLMEIIDPNGEYTQLQTVKSETVRADYSLSTLVFDIDVTMAPKADPTSADQTKFTGRWYLRLASSFDTAFVSRAATPGVGFFMTERASVSRIQRLKRPRTIVGAGDLPSAHYYIKNVPMEYRAAFKDAFDSWNALGQKLFAKPMLTYEHVETTDPRYALLIPGDARFHIIEWDLDNLAPYGGLGPSLANQHTGEIFSANVLVQGPKIVEIYSQWFKASVRATELEQSGFLAEAAKTMLDARNSIQAKLGEPHKHRIQMTLGHTLNFRVPAQDPSLEDPLMAKMEFEPVPAGYTYEQYMAGYFRELVGHELGHNVGLRHNFRGNLSSTGHRDGEVSSSVMEYLGRGHRHLNRIGAYDEMAMRYGYLGTAPSVVTGYCTDEDVPDATTASLSAECSRDDASSDPFSFFIERLERSAGYLTAPGSTDAPTWSVKDMDTELSAVFKNLGIYAVNPSTVAAKWTNFFGKAGRPRNTNGVKAYVLNQVKDVLCSDDLVVALDEKTSRAARQKTLDNIQALTAKASAVLTQVGAYSTTELACE
jgi:hypothetical protein